MTQHRVVINLEDKEGWQQWVDCLAAMVDELRLLTVQSVDKILDKYECRRCDYGMGLNVDWPEGARRMSVPDADILHVTDGEDVKGGLE